MRILRKIFKITLFFIILWILGIVGLYVIAYFQPNISLNTANSYYIYDIKNMIEQYKMEYSFDKPNNIFFTTSALRDYHYTKQKNNAYYHIQAINLPFQNIEFYYLDKEFKNE